MENDLAGSVCTRGTAFYGTGRVLAMPQRVPQDPETAYVQTSDGWRLAIHRWRPQGRTRRYPVLMIHGLGSNRFNFHPREDRSIASTLCAWGFDVFVLELRGAGLSMPIASEGALDDWTFDTYADCDVPTAIQWVRERTGASRVHGLGHSLGGMLLYRIGVTHREQLKSLVSVAAPYVRELGIAPRERRLLRLARRLAMKKGVKRLPLRRLTAPAVHLGPVGAWLVHDRLLNGANMDADVLAFMAQEAVEDIPTSLLRDLDDWVDGAMEELGPFDYEKRLHVVDMPLLVLSGSVDRIAPPNSVRKGFLATATTRSVYREMGCASGDAIDYGHLDLLVGVHAPNEVFPIIVDFLDDVDSL